MKIITIKSEKNDVDNIVNMDGDIIFLKNANKELFSSIKGKLSKDTYKFFKYNEDNSLIISKLMFSIISNKDNNLKNGCEIYIPGSESTVLFLDSSEGLNLEYKASIKHNKLIIIYQEDGIHEYNYSNVVVYSA